MFTNSAHLYDAVYSFKDYGAESERLQALIEERSPGASTLLDVACGTGKHLEQLRAWYEVSGLDLDPQLLEIAQERLGDVELHEGDMTSFSLGRTVRRRHVPVQLDRLRRHGRAARRRDRRDGGSSQSGRRADRRAVADAGRMGRRPAAPALGRRAGSEDRAHDHLRPGGPARDHELRVPRRHPGRDRGVLGAPRGGAVHGRGVPAGIRRRRALRRARPRGPDRPRALHRAAVRDELGARPTRRGSGVPCRPARGRRADRRRAVLRHDRLGAALGRRLPPANRGRSGGRRRGHRRDPRPRRGHRAHLLERRLDGRAAVVARTLRALGWRDPEPPWEPVVAAMVLAEEPPRRTGSRSGASRRSTTISPASRSCSPRMPSRRRRWRGSGRRRGRRSSRRTRRGGLQWLAMLDEEPVAFAIADRSPVGLYLAGGATLPEARGRGCYRALVRARWDEA